MDVPLRTLERAVNLVDQVADLDSPDGFGSLVMTGLSELIGCDVVTYNEVGTAPGDVHYEDWPAHSLNESTRATFARYAHQHPSINHYRRTGDGRAVTIRDFLTTREFHELDLYREFFRWIPVEEQLSVTMSDAGPVVVGIALNRARCEFDDVDRAVLTVLRRPLIAGLRRAQLRAAATARVKVPPDRELTMLSPREAQIMRLVAEGRTNEAIAHTLGISPRTVAKHLERIYRKLHAANRAAAVSRATGLPA